MLCPCGSQKQFEECCKPIIDGTIKAPNPEALMRARYSAHATQAFNYLTESTHPEYRDEVDAAEIAQWSSKLHWEGLTILAVHGGEENDTEGEVSFQAKYTVNGVPQELTEDAVFRKEGDTWYYVDGTIQAAEPVRREKPKVGRNETCPCGSGKKYKKCCMDKE